MRYRILGVLRAVRLQILLLTCILGIYTLSTVGVLLSPAQLRDYLGEFFMAHGAVAVAPISFLENLGGLNVYFPGSIAILAAMAFTSGDPFRGLVTFSAIVGPAFVAHQINFGVGRRLAERSVNRGVVTVSKEQQRRRLRLLAFVATLWHPHFAAVTCIQAGASGMPYRKFVGLFAPVFLGWNIVWGLTMYCAGGVLAGGDGVFPFVLVYITIWLIWGLAKAYRQLEDVSKEGA